jgi:hypothetical protein
VTLKFVSVRIRSESIPKQGSRCGGGGRRLAGVTDGGAEPLEAAARRAAGILSRIASHARAVEGSKALSLPIRWDLLPLLVRAGSRIVVAGQKQRRDSGLLWAATRASAWAALVAAPLLALVIRA